MAAQIFQNYSYRRFCKKKKKGVLDGIAKNNYATDKDYNHLLVKTD